MPTGQVVESATRQPSPESATQQPSPLHVPDTIETELGIPSIILESVQEHTAKAETTAAFESPKEGAIDPFIDKIPSNSSKVSWHSETDIDMKQHPQGQPSEVHQLNATESLKGNGDVDKEKLEQNNVKDNSISSKISDGPSSSRKTNASAKVSDRVESAKSSMCRASTSSGASDESTSSSLSCNISKPHRSNDSRWEAIQEIRARNGVIGLNHFRLLKRLGCGDIGTVYLSELSGTKCYFAMKIMDKVSLASRKKLLRAQTEREILQCLDHPFLPTLYTHFETEKFSCLVMENCPGGDLHTLRQRQPGKFFSEQAVK